MTAFRYLALLPALALSSPVWAQATPDADPDGVVILFGEDLPDPEPLPQPAEPGADGRTAFEEPDPFDLPQIAVPEAPSVAAGSVPDLQNTVETVAIPDDWIAHDEWGVRFALPPAFEQIERDEDEDGEAMLVWGTLNMEARSGVTYTIGFVPPREADSMAEEFGDQFGLGPLQPNPDPTVIDGLAWRDYVAEAPAVDLGGVTARVALRVLMRDEPNGYGFVPVLMMLYFTDDRADYAETERVFLGSMEFSDTLGAPPPISFSDGAIRFQLPPGARFSGLGDDLVWIVYEEQRVDYARVVLEQQGTEEWAAESFLRSAFNGQPTVRTGDFAGQPVWIVEGRPAFTLNGGVRTQEGDAWRAMSIVPQVCDPVGGLLTITAITTTDRIASGLTLEGMLAPVVFDLGRATPCPERVAAAFGGAIEQAAGAMQPQAPAQSPEDPAQPPVQAPVVQPPVVDPPVPQAPVAQAPIAQAPIAQPPAPPAPTPQPGKPAQPAAPPPAPVAPSAPDPETLAWTQAEAAQTAGAMLDYLAAWPQGAHAEQARAWLSARAIMAPPVGQAAQPSAPQPDPEALAWSLAERAQSADAMLRYLQDWPQGAHAEQVRDWLWMRGIVAPPATQPAPGGK